MKFGQLESFAVIKISGEDAATFLQGQLTNDINALDQNWQLSGYCNPKGRLLALLQIWQDSNNNFYALLSKDLSQSIIKRLSMYVMRSKVIIEELQNKTLTAFVDSSALIALLPEMKESIKPKTKHQVIHSNTTTTLIVNKRALMISDEMVSSAESSSFDSQWQQYNIEDGLPTVTQASSELFIPQMINLDLLDGINFKKGCYTGQEIVARMHYLGKLKQRMFVCDLGGDLVDIVDIKAGDKITLDDATNVSSVGNIVAVTEGSTQCLAVIKLASLGQSLLLENGITIKARDNQPYPIN